jgi:hypothetical protein
VGSAQKPEAGAGEGGPRVGRQAEELGCGMRSGPSRKNSFSFSFPNFSKPFSKDFQIQFEFD